MDREAQRQYWERRAERPILFLAVVFLFILILPAALPLTPATKTTLTIINYAIWGLFVLDYAVRLYLAENRWSYIKKHPIEFLIVAIPFLRPLRILRLLPISAYIVKHAKGSFEKRIISFVAFTTVFIAAPACVAMYEVERNAKGSTIKTFGDSLWWAVTTMTTVGYGDRYPVTNTGRIIAGFVILAGISLVGLLTAAVAAIFIGSREDEIARDVVNFEKVLNRLDALELKIDTLSQDISKQVHRNKF